MLGSQGLGLGSVGTAAQIGGGNAVTPVLAAVYLAGAGDVPNDDVFAMPSGNLRFLGDAGSGGVPGVAFFESATTPGDPRLATWFTRRYLQTGAHTGRIDFGAMVGFDPGWDGSFSSLDGISIAQSLIGYTNSAAETSAAILLEIGESRFRSYSGFGVGSITYPTTGGGAVENFELGLYNSIFATTYDGHYFTGWGQYVIRPLAQLNGITAIIDARPDFRQISPVAGDGAGYMIRHLDDGTPRGMFEAHMLAADSAGDYGIGLWAYIGSGAGLAKILDADWTNGITLNAPLVANWAPTVPGTTAVTISNSPGSDATPVEYLAIKNNAGQTRYIALLA